MNEGSFVASNPSRFEAAQRLFDEENSGDPNKLLVHGISRPRELVYAQWLSDWVLRLEPHASEALRLAARSAHLCRWSIRRDTYPMTRPGYLRWRQELKTMHAGKVGQILQGVGYAPEFVERVKALVAKRDFPNDKEGRVLEDALCLVFLEHQFADLSAKSADEKMINALQKTWKKMTPPARAIAMTLTYGPRERALVERALGPSLP